jgi:hypothetical protein
MAADSRSEGALHRTIGVARLPRRGTRHSLLDNLLVVDGILQAGNKELWLVNEVHRHYEQR